MNCTTTVQRERDPWNAKDNAKFITLIEVDSSFHAYHRKNSESSFGPWCQFNNDKNDTWISQFSKSTRWGAIKCDNEAPMRSFDERWQEYTRIKQMSRERKYDCTLSKSE